MRPHLKDALSLSFILLLAGSLGIYYVRAANIEASTQYSLETQAIQRTMAEQRGEKLKQLLIASETSLAEKQAELAAKQAEIEKATQELAAKAKQLAESEKKIKDQQSQIKANASELEELRKQPPLFSFSVTNSSLTNVEQKKKDVEALVRDSYSVIRDVYGLPYLLHAVKIEFASSLASADAHAEIVISNSQKGLTLTIRILDFDKTDFNDVNAVIHEVIHSFHGLAYLPIIAYEEGITVAAADVVMQKLIAQGKITAFKPLYIRISESEYLNAAGMPEDTEDFYNSSDVANFYQVAGYGWYQLYVADSNFFKEFNEKIYAHRREGNELTREFIISAIKSVSAPQVAGRSINSWLETKAFALTR